MNEQKALVVLGIAEAVVDQVPVESVRPPLPRMATVAALPSLQADPAIVEIEFAFSDQGHCWFGPQR
ncbi:hypothetical protein SDC9_203122 [bioreactor metagenome]|uniref:Uncharacterized protein n=1 Tax=bioreactor metagenome TaxID=1076179 RepID=A0A645IX16_9ZZZZ